MDKAVVLTGSSSSNLRDSIGDLAGRRGPVEAPDRVMLPMGFRTFVNLNDPIYARIGYGDARAVDETALSEQQLGMALLRSSLRHGNGIGHANYADFDRVLYFRSATSAEIDFVGPDFGGLAIESKYADDRWRRSAGRTLTASPWRGLVATRTELDLEEPLVTVRSRPLRYRPTAWSMGQPTAMWWSPEHPHRRMRIPGLRLWNHALDANRFAQVHLRAQPVLFGEVASDSTLYHTKTQTPPPLTNSRERSGLTGRAKGAV